MIENQLTRKELISQIDIVSEKVLTYMPNSSQVYRINELISDIHSDYYTVVVVGEFNNGKSTFVNAIIGEDLLPVGVTPTTATINTLVWGGRQDLIHSYD
jgi:ribosome biogenesis GTPase A